MRSPALASLGIVDCLQVPPGLASDWALIAPVVGQGLVRAQRHACGALVVIEDGVLDAALRHFRQLAEKQSQYGGASPLLPARLRTESCLPPGFMARHPEVRLPVHHEVSDASGRGRAGLRAVPRTSGGPPRAAVLRRLLPVGRDALRHRPHGCRLLDSLLLGLPGVQRLSRRRSRRSPFADVPATRTLLQQATDPASARGRPGRCSALATASRRPPSRRGWVCAPPPLVGRLPTTGGGSRDPRACRAGAGRISPELG